jgi:hypothetical protein
VAGEPADAFYQKEISRNGPEVWLWEAISALASILDDYAQTGIKSRKLAIPFLFLLSTSKTNMHNRHRKSFLTVAVGKASTSEDGLGKFNSSLHSKADPTMAAARPR